MKSNRKARWHYAVCGININLINESITRAQKRFPVPHAYPHLAPIVCIVSFWQNKPRYMSLYSFKRLSKETIPKYVRFLPIRYIALSDSASQEKLVYKSPKQTLEHTPQTGISEFMFYRVRFNFTISFSHSMSRCVANTSYWDIKL